MILLRSLLFFFFFIATTFLIALYTTLIGWFLSRDKLFKLDRLWAKLNLKALKFICRLDYKVDGLENIEKNCIYLAKHQSTWETIALITIIPAPRAWVIKRELLFVPVFGWVMIHFKPIAINRKSGQKAAQQIINQGTEKLASGHSIIIFPEGTRTAPGERRKYGLGGPLLAEHSGYPVIPIAHNAGVYWKRRGILKYPGVIHVKVGKKIHTKGKNAQEIKSLVEEWIEEEQAHLQQV